MLSSDLFPGVSVPYWLNTTSTSGKRASLDFTVNYVGKTYSNVTYICSTQSITNT